MGCEILQGVTDPDHAPFGEDFFIGRVGLAMEGISLPCPCVCCSIIASSTAAAKNLVIAMIVVGPMVEPSVFWLLLPSKSLKTTNKTNTITGKVQ